MRLRWLRLNCCRPEVHDEAEEAVLPAHASSLLVDLSPCSPATPSFNVSAVSQEEEICMACPKCTVAASTIASCTIPTSSPVVRTSGLSIPDITAFNHQEPKTASLCQTYNVAATATISSTITQSSPPVSTTSISSAPKSTAGYSEESSHGGQDNVPCGTDKRTKPNEDSGAPMQSNEASSIPRRFVCFLLAVLVTFPVAAELCPLAGPLLWFCIAAVVVVDGSQAHIMLSTMFRHRHTIARSARQHAGEIAYWLNTTAASCLLNVALLTGVAILCCCAAITQLAQQQKTLLAVATTECLMCHAQHIFPSSVSAAWTLRYRALLINHAAQNHPTTTTFHSMLYALPSSVQTQMAVLIVMALLLAALMIYLDVARNCAVLEQQLWQSSACIKCSIGVALKTAFRKSAVTANKELIQVPWEVELTIEPADNSDHSTTCRDAWGSYGTAKAVPDTAPTCSVGCGLVLTPTKAPLSIPPIRQGAKLHEAGWKHYAAGADLGRQEGCVGFIAPRYPHQLRSDAFQADVKPQNPSWSSSNKENASSAPGVKRLVPCIFPQNHNVQINSTPGFVGHHALPTSCVMQPQYIARSHNVSQEERSDVLVPDAPMGDEPESASVDYHIEPNKEASEYWKKRTATHVEQCSEQKRGPAMHCTQLLSLKRDIWARKKYKELTGRHKKGDWTLRRSSLHPAIYMLHEAHPASPEHDSATAELSLGLSFLGQGKGPAVVYAQIDIQGVGMVPCALKTLPCTTIEGRTEAEAELRAFQKMSDNDSIIDCHGVFWDADAQALIVAMTFCDGVLLADWEKHVRAYSTDQQECVVKQRLQTAALQITYHLAEAVAQMQKQGWGHNDLKPINIMVIFGKNCRVVKVMLLDIGCSTNYHGALRLRPIGMEFTIGYAAPEVLAGLSGLNKLKTYACANDTWAIGCILTFLITGCNWFDGSSVREIHQLQKQWAKEEDKVQYVYSRLRPHVTDFGLCMGLSALLESMLSTSIVNRCSASHVVMQLQKCL